MILIRNSTRNTVALTSKNQWILAVIIGNQWILAVMIGDQWILTVMDVIIVLF